MEEFELDDYFKNYDSELAAMEYEVEENIRGEMNKAALMLEKKFEQEGLKFTTPFNGAVPVQAYGELWGLRFYFRYRYDVVSLILGPVDEEADKKDTKQQEENRARRISELNHPEDCDCFSCLMYSHPITPFNDDLDTYYPLNVHYRGAVENYSGERYGGSFSTAEEAVDAFTKVFENLERVGG